jgi:AAA domain-containing protein
MTTSPTFRKAERHAVKARIALAGPSGSGKTYTGLTLASGLSPDGRIAVLDTEKGSSELYADEFNFDVLNLDPPFSPQRYVAGINAAVEAGYQVILVDSLSHAWSDEGGVLDIVDQEAVRTQGNKFAAWRKGTPEQQRLLNGLIRSPIHVIVTMRSKQDYAVDTDDRGRTRVRKLGLAPIQREGVEYEFSVFGELDLDHTLSISKSRYHSLQDLVIKKPGPDFAQQVLKEVEVGEPAAVTVPDEDPPAPASETQGDDGPKATRPQITKLHALAGRLGWTDEEKHKLAGVASLNDLTKDQASGLIEAWEAKETAVAEEKAATTDGEPSGVAEPSEGAGMTTVSVEDGATSDDPELDELRAQAKEKFGSTGGVMVAAHKRFPEIETPGMITAEHLKVLLEDVPA